MVEPEANARKTISVGIRIAVGAAVVVRPAAIWGIRPDRDSPEPKSVEAMEAIEMPAHYVAVASLAGLVTGVNGARVTGPCQSSCCE